MNFVEATISFWFLTYRPDMRLEPKTLHEIVEQVKPYIADMEQLEQRIYIKEFLNVNYNPEMALLIHEILDNNEEKFGSTVNDWKNMGLFNSEIGAIMANISEKNVADEYIIIQENGTIGYQQEFKEKIALIIDEYVTNYWL